MVHTFEQNGDNGLKSEWLIEMLITFSEQQNIAKMEFQHLKFSDSFQLSIVLSAIGFMMGTQLGLLLSLTMSMPK
ncbi:hypothetical protein ACLOJK_032836 [Asimina triloba]